MKRIIAYLMLLLALAMPTLQAQTNDEPQLKLRQGSNLEGFDYTYISPWMLKSMQQKDQLTTLKNIPVRKVKHIEILKTDINGEYTSFKSIINKLSDELKLIAYNREKDSGVKVCAEITYPKDEFGCPVETVNRLLVIQWSKYGKAHSVIYIVGELTPQEVNDIFHI